MNVWNGAQGSGRSSVCIRCLNGTVGHRVWGDPAVWAPAGGGGRPRVDGSKGRMGSQATQGAVVVDIDSLTVDMEKKELNAGLKRVVLTDEYGYGFVLAFSLTQWDYSNV